MRRRALAALLALLLVPQLAGCGTILYPERHGQHRGRVDPAVLLFDSALLLLFVVPGLVAFGIDFHTGAIYLPGQGRKVSVLRIPPRELSRERIEAELRNHTGLRLRLDDPRIQRRPLRPGDDPAAALRLARWEIRPAA